MVGRALGVNVWRFPFERPRLTADPARMASVVGDVVADLAERGLSRGGELDARMRAGFSLFGTARVSIGVAGADETGTRFAVLGLADGRDELIVALQDNSFTVDLYDDAGMPGNVVRALPSVATDTRQPTLRVPAAPAGRPAPRSDDDFFGAAGIGQRVMAAPTVARRGSEVDAVARLLAGPRRGGGVIAIDGLLRDGGRGRGPRLSWVDTKDGRFLVEKQPDAESGKVIYAPVDQQRLTSTLQQHIAQLK